MKDIDVSTEIQAYLENYDYEEIKTLLSETIEEHNEKFEK